MSERFYLQQMEHFKVKTRFEFITSKPKQVKVSKPDLVAAVLDLCDVDCQKMTIPQLRILFSALMVHEPNGEHSKYKVNSKLEWQKHIGCYLGVDYDIFKNLTIDKLKQLEKALT